MTAAPQIARVLPANQWFFFFSAKLQHQLFELTLQIPDYVR
jgi:hypothetical protein